MFLMGVKIYKIKLSITMCKLFGC